MPRRHRSARDRQPPEPVRRPTGVVPAWALTADHDVKPSSKGGSRCPGCNQPIRDGVPHFVVMAEGDLEGRRHWHVGCWRVEQRRTGRSS